MTDDIDITPKLTVKGKELEIDLYDDVLIIRHKGISNTNEVMKEWLPFQVKKLEIHQKDNELDGYADISTDEETLKLEFKSYQRKDFETLKLQLKL